MKSANTHNRVRLLRFTSTLVCSNFHPPAMAGTAVAIVGVIPNRYATSFENVIFVSEFEVVESSNLMYAGAASTGGCASATFHGTLYFPRPETTHFAGIAAFASTASV